MLQALLDAIRLLPSRFNDWLNGFLTAVWGYFWTLIENRIESMGWLFPEITMPAWAAGTNQFFTLANYYLPLSEGFTLLAAYVTLYIVFMPIKIVIRHLPVIGG